MKEPASNALPPAPVLLIEAAPWHRIFLQNASDLFWPNRLPSLHLSSAPGEFWPDVFVASKLPWRKVPLSAMLHLAMVAAMLMAARIWPQPTQIVTPAKFDSRDVISYSPDEELPPLDTGGLHVQPVQRGEPAYSAQPIISVPPEAQSRRQTVVAPPAVKLAQDVPSPNVIAWKQAPPSVPIAATENVQSRKAPALAFTTVAPAPELTQLASQRATLSQPSVVAPQPQLQANLSHRVDVINIGHQQVVAPAPQLPVAESHTAPRMAGLDAVQAAAPQPTINVESRRNRMALPQSAVVAPAPNIQTPAERHVEHSLTQEQVVAPAPNAAHLDIHAKNRVALGEPSRAVPPAPSALSLTAKASDRQIIALNLHPATGVAPPEANRRGTFAATPQGKKDAAGTPDIANTPGKPEISTNKTNALPPGLHVGVAENKPQQSSTGSSNQSNGEQGAGDTSDHALMASVAVPRVTGRPAKEVPEVSATDDDRKIFGGHKFYSMAMNFANLNSGGGSWIFHFAELKDSQKGTLMAPEVERQVDPAYPTELMRQNVHGTVVLYALIGSDGSVNDVRVLESVDDRLDEFAREALSKWHFRPATKNGNPVALTMIVKVPFRPARGLF